MTLSASWIRPLFAAVLAMACVEGAFAYTGGPECVEVLGWDPADRKVFCAIHDLSESGLSPGLMCFPLDSLRQSLGTRVHWSRKGTGGAIVRDARWGRIVRRLQPLELVWGPALPRWNRVLVADSVETPFDGKVARFKVRVGIPWDVGGTDVHVTTYYHSVVAIPHVYRVPGRAELLVVLSFIGKPHGGEEVQVPVLWRGPSASPIDIEWHLWDEE